MDKDTLRFGAIQIVTIPMHIFPFFLIWCWMGDKTRICPCLFESLQI